MRRPATVNTNIRAVGYPERVGNATNLREMFAGVGSVTQVSIGQNVFTFSAIVSNGNSGGPVLDGSIVLGTVTQQSQAGLFGTGLGVLFHDAKWNAIMARR